MKTRLFLFVAGLLTICASETFGQVQFEPVVKGNFGYENNVFQTPDRLRDDFGNYIPESDLIVSDMFIDGGYVLGLKYKVKRHRLYFDQGLWGRYYLNNQNLNQYDINLDITYKYKFSRQLYGGISYKVDKKMKIGNTVLGDELMQRFSYFQNEINAFLDADISKSTNATLYLDWYNKMYDKDPAVTPLDANNLGAGIKLSQDIGSGDFKSTVDLAVSYDIRKYANVISLDAAGDYDPLYPLRDWRYFGVDLGYNIDPAGIFEFTPYYKFDRRIDMFEDYYSYLSNEVGMKLYIRGKRIFSRLVPSYNIVNYDVKSAPGSPTTDPLLVYKYLNVDFQMNIILYKGITFNVGAGTRNRNSNTLDESWTTRRGYRAYEVMAGFSFNPYKLFVDTKVDEDELK